MRPKGISIGDFNQRVTFYTQSTSGVNSFGNPILSTGTGVVRWADVSEKMNTYTREDGGIEYQNEYKITVRRPLTVSEGDRVDYNDLQCHITSIEVTQATYYVLKAVAISTT